MNLRAIVVGLDHWEDYTKPALLSIRRTNPEINITCVDNGSDVGYGHIAGVSMIISEKKRSYAGGINLGIKWAEEADWYIILNNDILFEKFIEDRFRLELDPQVLYGFKLWDKGTAGMPTEYLCGWCLFLSRWMYEAIGDFDEKCAPMFFEDADYSIRVLKAGYKLQELDRANWGLRHLEDERMSERVAYYQRNKDARNAIRNYVRHKHGYS